jgi:hypothetical protein
MAPSRSTQAITQYARLLAKAGPEVIPSADKAKLEKLLAQILTELKMGEDLSGKLDDQHSGIMDDLMKAGDKAKKYDASVRDFNKKLEDSKGTCHDAIALADKQKGFDKSKDFADFEDKLKDVIDWFDILERKELKLETLIQQGA